MDSIRKTFLSSSNEIMSTKDIFFIIFLAFLFWKARQSIRHLQSFFIHPLILSFTRLYALFSQQPFNLFWVKFYVTCFQLYEQLKQDFCLQPLVYVRFWGSLYARQVQYAILFFVKLLYVILLVQLSFKYLLIVYVQVSFKFCVMFYVEAYFKLDVQLCVILLYAKDFLIVLVVILFILSEFLLLFLALYHV